MPAEPLFSVVMPAYQSEETIAPAIESVLAQTRDDFELLVVDDGSTDATADRAQPYTSDNRVRLVRQPHNRGLAATRNTGIAESHGRYVSMLDSDDLWLPRYLEVMAETLAGRPDAGFAYTDAWVLDHGSRRILRTSAMHYQHPPNPPPPDALGFLAELIERNFVFTSATVPRSVLEHVGGFNTEVPAAEDYDLWLRIAVAGFPGVRAPGRLAIYRKRPGTLSTNEQLMFRGLVEAYDDVAQDERVPERLRARATARRRAAERALAAVEGRRDVRATLERARRRAVRLKQVVALRLLRSRRVPAEVRSAFPDLRAV